MHRNPIATIRKEFDAATVGAGFHGLDLPNTTRLANAFVAEFWRRVGSDTSKPEAITP